MKMKSAIFVLLAVAAVFCRGAVSVTASRDYVDKHTELHPVIEDGGTNVVGYFVGIQTNKVLVSEYGMSKNTPGDYYNVSNAAMNARSKTDLNVYTNASGTAEILDTGDRLATTGQVAAIVGNIKSDRITDGTNTIDAAGNVYVKSDEWSFALHATGIASDATSDEIRSEMSMGAPVWGYGLVDSASDVVQGWFIYRSQAEGYYQGDSPDSVVELYSYEYLGVQDGPLDTVIEYNSEYDWDGDLVSVSGTIQYGMTTVVGKLALTNDIDYTTSNTQLVATIEATAPAPGNYAAVSNRAMFAIQEHQSLQPSTNYTDAALGAFAATGAVFRAATYGTPTWWTDATGCVWVAVLSEWVLADNARNNGYGMQENEHGWYIYSGNPDIVLSEYAPHDALSWNWGVDDWSGGVPYGATSAARSLLTNLVGRVALTNDILPAVTVVYPSTNAAAGTAADAKATGTALYTGFTEWEFSGLPDGWDVRYLIYEDGTWEIAIDDIYGNPHFENISNSIDATELIFVDHLDGEYTITASRHLVTPTKTSQLTNDSGFAVLSEEQLSSICSSVPAYLEEVEYVEFTGGQYVDLGFKANQGTIKIDFVVTPQLLYPWPSGVNQTYHALLGSRYSTVGSTPSGRICNAFLSRGGTLRPDMVCGMAYYPSEIPLPFDVTSRVILERGTVIVDGVYTNTAVPTTTGPQVDQGVSFFLGYMNEEVPSGTAFAKYCGYWGPTRIYRAGVLFMDLVPVRKYVDGGYAGFFYDRVSGALFGGTPSALIAGPIRKRSVPPLSGKTYDFATNKGLYLAVRNIVEALGGGVTNFPAISQ